MSEAENAVQAAFAIGLRPDIKMTVSQWSDRYRVLPRASASEPGKMRISRVPYMREILDELSSMSRTTTVTLMKGVQVGATEGGNSWVGSIIHHTPGPILYVMPTLDLAKRTSRQRLQPMINACPELRGLIDDRNAKDSGNAMLSKEFEGGILVLAGANSAAGLRSMPARFLFMDEMSAYEGDIDGEGDPVELAKGRTATFKRHKKIFQPSTPKLKGQCRIEAEFNKSDQCYYNVPCPHCKELQVIRWANIKWDKSEEGKHLPETAHLVCTHCGCRIRETDKTWMFAEENGARWIPTAVGEKNHRGFHLSALYSPWGWFSWVEAVRLFLNATEAAKNGDTSLLKSWTNMVLGETWVTQGTEINHHKLWKRREEYPLGFEVPRGGAFLAAGVDVQQDRIEASVYAFGEWEESWAIEHRIFYGNPSDKADVCWKQLDDLLFSTTYRHESGHEVRIMVAGVDTGFLTSTVYDYIKDRQHRGVYALKGDFGKEGVPIISKANKKTTGRDKRPVNLFIVGTFEAKRLIFGRLSMARPEPGVAAGGYIHYPILEDFDEEFFEQLTAERITEGFKNGRMKRQFENMRKRNEALDCAVYAYAALTIYRPNLHKYCEQLNGSRVEQPAQVEQQVQMPVSRVQRPMTRRKNGYLNGW